MRHAYFRTLILALVAIAGHSIAFAQAGTPEHLLSLAAEAPISFPQEKRLTAWLLALDPHATLLVDEDRRDIVTRSRAPLDLAALLEAGSAQGMVLRPNEVMNTNASDAQLSDD